MSIIEQIKAEIERLKKAQEVSEDYDYAQYELDVACGYDMACDDILSFLSTIESEKPVPAIEEPIDGVLYAAACGIKNADGKTEKPMNQEELEKEIETYFDSNFGIPWDGCHPIGVFELDSMARHFAKWGAEHAKKDEIPVPSDLEEAAWDCVLDNIDVNNPILLPKYKVLLTSLFIDGAKWQKEQDDRLVDIIYQQGIKKGKDDMKEQMMQEAVDADVMLTLHDKTGDISLHTGYLPKELGIKCDDKVKIIIVNEDEK